MGHQYQLAHVGLLDKINQAVGINLQGDVGALEAAGAVAGQIQGQGAVTHALQRADYRGPAPSPMIGAMDQNKGCHLYLKLGLRFSRNAVIPSRLSAPARALRIARASFSSWDSNRSPKLC